MRVHRSYPRLNHAQEPEKMSLVYRPTALRILPCVHFEEQEVQQNAIGIANRLAIIHSVYYYSITFLYSVKLLLTRYAYSAYLIHLLIACVLSTLHTF